MGTLGGTAPIKGPGLKLQVSLGSWGKAPCLVGNLGVRWQSPQFKWSFCKAREFEWTNQHCLSVDGVFGRYEKAFSSSSKEDTCNLKLNSVSYDG